MSSASSSVVSSLPNPRDQSEPPTVKNTKNESNFTSSITNPLNNYYRKSTADSDSLVYVPPLSKFSSSSLTSSSSLSLEMCTESLGSETGSDIDHYSNYGDEMNHYHDQQKRKTRELNTVRKSKPVTTTFPPPLTSISGSDGVQLVQTHREGGRLVIKAFSCNSRGANFHAQRENGRLRLFSYYYFGGDDDNCGAESVIEDEDDEEENDDANGDDDDDGSDHGREGGFVGSCFWGDHQNGNESAESAGINVGWSSNIIRCNGDNGNDGSKRIPSLPFCVAIS